MARPKCKDKTLASLLLWDDRGQDLFEEILSCQQYYPFRAEIELLERNCQKTLLLLTALEAQRKPVAYFALDVAEDGLRLSLSSLLKQVSAFQYVTCHGLLGTYEDCVDFLNSDDARSRQHTIFLWLGNSIANMAKEEATHLLQRLLHWKSESVEMLVSIDGCRNSDFILHAYDLLDQRSRAFVRNGLVNLNRVLGDIVFQKDDWGFEGLWDPSVGEHRSYHVAKKAMSLQIVGKDVCIEERERVLAVTSAKWRSADVTCL
ncbi:MAG: hypothetical protein MMC33_001937 [Icmadophila ericetorum]|nr:hypothetical protein [Icmadophila ericetorum]